MGQISALMAATMPLRVATMNARKRLNDATISTRVKAGKVQVGRVTYQKNVGDFAPLSDWLTMDEAVVFIERL